MNLAINGTCAKGCSFCFTKEDARLKHTLGNMTIEMVDKIINHYHLDGHREEITILGGEPTQHPDFINILNYIFSKNIKINLVSNFLFGKTTRDYLIENIKNVRWVFPNAAELNEKTGWLFLKRTI
jgi:organic radical activating enzyme